MLAQEKHIYMHVYVELYICIHYLERSVRRHLRISKMYEENIREGCLFDESTQLFTDSYLLKS